MATHVQHIRRVNDAGAMDNRAVMEDDTRTEIVEESPGVLASRVVWFVAGVIIALLAFRFVLMLAGANRGSGFVDFIYNVSYPFAAPFFGIFNYHTTYGTSRIELTTLVAIAVYALIAWGIERLLTIRRPRTTV
ncbi:MAG TPA: hypothetical protein VN031_00040 [Candidatus Microsaccharimonas sp.]|nr:hypothetical protein [Candidatus Microsaccharimonas sp.]